MRFWNIAIFAILCLSLPLSARGDSDTKEDISIDETKREQSKEEQNVPEKEQQSHEKGNKRKSYLIEKQVKEEIENETEEERTQRHFKVSCCSLILQLEIQKHVEELRQFNSTYGQQTLVEVSSRLTASMLHECYHYITREKATHLVALLQNEKKNLDTLTLEEVLPGVEFFPSKLDPSYAKVELSDGEIKTAILMEISARELQKLKEDYTKDSRKPYKKKAAPASVSSSFLVEGLFVLILGFMVLTGCLAREEYNANKN